MDNHQEDTLLAVAQTMSPQHKTQFASFLGMMDAVKDYLTVSVESVTISGKDMFPLIVHQPIKFTDEGETLPAGRHFFEAKTEQVYAATQTKIPAPLDIIPTYALRPLTRYGTPLHLAILIYCIRLYMPLEAKQAAAIDFFADPEAEAREALPRLASIIPDKHIMPNNKLVNSLKDLVDAGPYDLIVSGRGKTEITTHCLLSYEGDNVTLCGRRPFTAYDRSVADAVVSLYEHGDDSHIITPATVFRAMVNAEDAETPSPQQLGAVTRSLDKMRFIRVQIDCTDELKRRRASLNGDQIVNGKAETYLLNMDKLEILAGGKTVTAYRINQTPILYDYARLTNQVLTIPAKLLVIKDSTGAKIANTERRIVVKDYLLRRISVMKGKTNQSRHIKYSKLFEETSETDLGDKEKKAVRKYIDSVLDSWKRDGFIKGYTHIKDGRTKTGVEIIL